MRKRTSPGRSVVCDLSGRSDVCCFVRSVLNEHRQNHRKAAENMSGREPLSLGQDDNLLSEENESANSSPQGIDNALANVLSAMTQMTSTMLSMEKAMKRLAEEPEDHATPPKRRRNLLQLVP